MSKIKLDGANIGDTSTIQNIDINSEENVMKYCLMPSLKHIAITKIIITLWKQADVKSQIAKLLREREDYDHSNLEMECILFPKIKYKIVEKLSQIGVPDRIRKILSIFVFPIINEIIEWIRYQNINIFYNTVNQNMDHTATNYIDALVWTSRGVIDYKETAKTLLAKEGGTLSDDYKYNMACAFCLEDDIAMIAPKVINTTLNLNCFERQTMVYFWTAQITGDDYELEEAAHSYNLQYGTNYSTNECLFRVLVICNATNPVAIKYMWNKLSNEEKFRQIVPAIVLTPTRNVDISCFFLSQINKEQEKEIFNFTFANILVRFFDHWLWGHYFLPTIYHVRDIMSGGVFLNLIEHIMLLMQSKNDIEKYNEHQSALNEIWQCAPKHLKEYVFERDIVNGFGRYRGGTILLNVYFNKNFDLFELMLADISDVQKKRIIFSDYSFNKCQDYITSNQWDLLDMFLGSSLFTGEDGDNFKKRFMEENGLSTVVFFTTGRKWNKIDELTTWAFKSDDEVKEFRQNLTCIYNEVCEDILKSIKVNNKADFSELEDFLKWFVCGDEEEVVKCKAEIPQIFFNYLVCTLIEEDNYELLENILKWCFVNESKQVTRFKQHSFQGDQMHNIVVLLFNLIKQDDELQSLKRFSSYWCSTDDEINQFKTRILHQQGTGEGVCKELLCRDLFQLADEFVNWCCNSSQIQIDDFKNQTMTVDYMNFLNSISQEDRPRIFFDTKLMSWFNPSIENVIILKEKCRHLLWFQEIVLVLDNYIKKQQCIQDKAVNKDILIIV